MFVSKVLTTSKNRQIFNFHALKLSQWKEKKIKHDLQNLSSTNQQRKYVFFTN